MNPFTFRNVRTLPEAVGYYIVTLFGTVFVAVLIFVPFIVSEVLSEEIALISAQLLAATFAAYLSYQLRISRQYPQADAIWRAAAAFIGVAILSPLVGFLVPAALSTMPLNDKRYQAQSSSFVPSVAGDAKLPPIPSVDGALSSTDRIAPPPIPPAVALSEGRTPPPIPPAQPQGISSPAAPPPIPPAKTRDVGLTPPPIPPAPKP